MGNWIDNYIHNEGFDSNNHAFGFTSNVRDGREPNTLSKSLEEVIRQCSAKEKELDFQSFKKLKITVVDEYCFDTIQRLKTKKDSEYEYIILLSKDSMQENAAMFKHKFAHEIAHFLFTLKGTEFNSETEEQIECNKKAGEWGFLEPKARENE